MSADGTWKTTINSPMGVQEGTLTVVTSGATFTGKMTSRMGDNDISGTVDGDKLTWSSQLTSPMPMTLTFNVTFTGDTATGTVQAGAFGSSPLTAVRV